MIYKVAPCCFRSFLASDKVSLTRREAYIDLKVQLKKTMELVLPLVLFALYLFCEKNTVIRGLEIGTTYSALQSSASNDCHKLSALRLCLLT